MTRRFLARPIFTADNTDPPEVTQGFSVDASFLLRAVRLTVIQFNAPTYTGIIAKIYAERSSDASKEVAQSTNTVLPATVAPTEDHAFREVYFEFNDVVLKAGVNYRIGLIFQGYTGDTTSHMAWANSWPDPIYDLPFAAEQKNAAKYPKQISLIGVEF